MAAKDMHDAIVVGSGPAGGWVAKSLTESGLNVLVLEAGQSQWRMNARFFYERLRRAARYRVEEDPSAVSRQAIQSRCYAWPHHPQAFVDDVDHPYTTPDDRPFVWIRSRQEGGRMVVPRNGLEFYRFSDLDFRAASRDGFGDDWPVTYAELAPYYDRVEEFIGLTGGADGLAHLPDPRMIPQRKLTPAEAHLRSAVATRWSDRPLITRRTSSRVPFPIGAARATGRLVLRHEAVVREITVDPRTGLASGVHWLKNGRDHWSGARLVVLAASSIESARLLLNSGPGGSRDGLANTSGAVGCYLMDHTSVDSLTATITLPDAMLDATESYTYLPQFRNVQEVHPNFLRGYGIQIWTRGSDCTLTVRGEMLPRQTNRVTIDPVVKDRWGIPAVRIDCTLSDNEHAQLRDAVFSSEEMLAEAGFLRNSAEPSVSTLGRAIHECGTVRMGTDPRSSVLNRHNQSWDVRNLFVVDASCFVSQGVQNPTLTIMAMALRAAEYMVTQMKRREL